MSEIDVTFVDSPVVELLDVMGSDDKVAEMARGSVGKMRSTPERNARLINSLMEDGHKVPFEHCAMTFLIKCPIFVSRQLVKHRHSSFSELSGRYTELAPVFYVPSNDRPLGQEGSRMSYDMTMLDKRSHERAQSVICESSHFAWETYLDLLYRGVSREVARTVLPVNIFTEIRMTVNLLSLMNIIQLRVDWGDAGEKTSHPQFEVQQVALRMWDIFDQEFPVVAQAFKENGFQI